MIGRYTTQVKIHMKMFMSDVSVYNTHPNFRPGFRRKKCVGLLYAENYGSGNSVLHTLKNKLINFYQSGNLEILK